MKIKFKKNNSYFALITLVFESSTVYDTYYILKMSCVLRETK